jgi:hypothetical protein
MDLSESVIMPREDFIELSTVAFDNHHVPSVSERVGSTLQTTIVFGALAAAVTAGTWGYVKAHDWLEEKNFRRRIAEREAQKNPQ